MTQEKKERSEKEIAIILAASEVFSEKGFYLTTVEEVAKKAGIGKGTIYLYFKDKEDLFIQMLSYHFCELCRAIERISKTKSPILDKLKEVIKNNLRLFIRFGWIFEENLEISLKLRNKKREDGRRQEEAYFDMLAQLFIQAEKEGATRTFSDHHMTASTLVSCLHAAGINYARRKPDMPVDEYINRVSDFVLFGIAKP